MVDFSFTPKTEEELNREKAERLAARLLPVGEYQFEITKAEPKMSKAGKPMLAVTLKVFASDGSTRIVDDYIVNSEKMLHRVRHFLYSVGCGSMYESGNVVAEHLIGRCGKASFIQENDGVYDPKNRVKDYIVGEPGSAPATASAPSTSTAPAQSTSKTSSDEIPW